MTTSATPSRSVSLTPLPSTGGGDSFVIVHGPRFYLPMGGVMRIEKEMQARQLRVIAGKLWVTSTPAIRDFIVGAGQTMPLQSGWPFIAEALAHAEFEIVTA